MEQLTNSLMRRFYDEVVVGKYASDYELIRWFSSPTVRSDYFMTATTIRHHLQSLSFARCLEIGPGAGTWTKFVWRHNPAARFDLVDISAQMHKQFVLEMRSQSNVHYTVTDFMDFGSDDPYDLVFSVRTIEYMEDQQAALNKIISHLKPGGTGIIIAGNPSLIMKGHDTRVQHSGQISAQKMITLLEKAGAQNVSVYPVIVRIHLRTPLKDFRWLTFSEKVFHRWLSNAASPQKLQWCESFLVRFQRQ